MALTKHHDLINTDYFSNTLYIRELEISLSRKLTKIEKNIIEDTFRTIIKINNEWSNYSNKTDESFAKNKLELETYIKKYERTIKKSADTYCIELYNKCELWLDEIEEIERRNLDKKCNGIKTEITKILEDLDNINFDYNFNGFFYYKRNPSNKTKRHYVSLLDNIDVWKLFVNNYNENHYFELDINYKKTDIHYLYRVYADLSLYLSNEEYDKCINTIIAYSFANISFNTIKRDKVLNKASELLEQIAYMITNKDYEKAYGTILSFIKANSKWYIRAS